MLHTRRGFRCSIKYHVYLDAFPSWQRCRRKGHHGDIIVVFDSPQQRSRCGVIFYTHPRRVTPNPFVQTATSSLHFTPHVTLHKQHYQNTLSIVHNRTSKPNHPTNTQTHYRLKVFTFLPTAPTSHSQWSSRSTEYTRRSRTCPPEATGSCRNSVVRAWASSRWESLRTLCCKWGADIF